jgi:aspartyl-tRNA(Asn)/glutamyl-tRNA(Gln) amidotransferase subunit C
MSSKLTLTDLEHVAKLARIQLTDKEKTVFLPQLESVLEYLDKLNRVDTSKVSPSFQITDLKNIFRPDTVKPSLSQKSALNQASKTHDAYFVVPKTIDK